jgi:signal transduction histidine kinase
MQTDFLAVVTQELKNPLTAILGLTQMLTRPEFRDDHAKRARTVRALEARANDMSVIVDDLLLASRIERSGLALTRARVDLGGLVTEAAARFERSGHEQRIAVDADAHTIVAHVDRRRIAQAVGYLLDNAVKHSPPAGEICVRVVQEGESASIAVSDAGEGIPPEDLERVFDRFYKVASAKHDPGTGLGLFLVRSIAEAHGGSVTAVSKHGAGSTFTMRIPLV